MPPKGRLRKSKRLPLTKAEKAERLRQKVRKEISDFMDNDKLYRNFMAKMEFWMTENWLKVEDHFTEFDTTRKGVVWSDIFRAGLRDFECPLSELEIRVFIHKLDPMGTGWVKYTGFDKGLDQLTREMKIDAVETQMGKLEEELKLIDGEVDQEKKPEITLGSVVSEDDIALAIRPTINGRFRTRLQDEICLDLPKYINLRIRVAFFDGVDSHPGHLELIRVTTDTLIRNLVVRIGALSEVPSNGMKLYRDKRCRWIDRLLGSKTLEECGFRGGTFARPTKSVIYFDCDLEFMDCPLLNEGTMRYTHRKEIEELERKKAEDKEKETVFSVANKLKGISITP